MSGARPLVGSALRTTHRHPGADRVPLRLYDRPGVLDRRPRRTDVPEHLSAPAG
ncbi:hypothetical protein ACFW6C_20780 [Streptomyces fungicidicus]|uniref:hypothetical protein n=1 Tax=Streptomyces fungicidicus TaxID=68203 RepID=UPI0036891E68